MTLVESDPTVSTDLGTKANRHLWGGHFARHGEGITPDDHHPG